MPRRILLLALCLYLTLPLAAQESWVLSTPVTPSGPTVTDYRVWSLYLGRGEGVIRIVVEDNNFQRTTHVYADDPETGSMIATNLMIALNKADLSVKSLQRRIIERLVADGKLPVGTVEGTPE